MTFNSVDSPYFALYYRIR